jgi:hypothetical protein
MNMTPATIEKRHALQAFIERVVQPIQPVVGLVGIGSIAMGTARPDSDIDLVALLDPFDRYALPAEAIWRPEDGSFHSIFREIEGLQIDIARMDCSPGNITPILEGRRAELHHGWLAFDRDGRAATIIAEWIRYDDTLRISRLDEAFTWLDQHLGEDTPAIRWQTLGPLIAHDRLNAAYTYLVQALFALNRSWQPWRNREIEALLRLPLLPAHLSERLLAAACPPNIERTGYDQRVQVLRELMAETIVLAQAEDLYFNDPLDEAFIRSHEEPGRAWNLAEWNSLHQQRYGAS